MNVESAGEALKGAANRGIMAGAAGGSGYGAALSSGGGAVLAALDRIEDRLTDKLNGWEKRIEDRLAGRLGRGAAGAMAGAMNARSAMTHYADVARRLGDPGNLPDASSLQRNFLKTMNDTEKQFQTKLKAWTKKSEEWTGLLKGKDIDFEKVLKSGEAVKALAHLSKSFVVPAKAVLIGQSIAMTYANAVQQLAIPWPFNLIAMAATIAGGLSSVEHIRKQKFEYGGPIYGPSHAEGGVLAELEGGENVWSRKDVEAAGGHQRVEEIRKRELGGRQTLGTLRRHQNMTRQATYLGLTG